MRHFLLIVAVVLPAFAADELRGNRGTVVYRNLKSFRPPMINGDLKVGVPTVNVAIYLGETDGNPHGYVAAPEDLTASFERAKKIFTKAGVQLKLLWVKRAIVPPSWLSVQANDVTGFAAPPEINTYVGYRSAGWKLTTAAKTAFEGIIERHAGNNRTIYLLYLEQVKMACFDHTIKDRPKSGLSQPAACPFLPTCSRTESLAAFAASSPYVGRAERAAERLLMNWDTSSSM